ncbi:Hypothetical predicted protein [Mytilus galloprovincialis]|uniref:EF-hand domain-containing protein n=1 Tax=Mytilus galloprovincialis TaxID=29158 RepID=A0A8B6F0A0_MYTGA|nr:Hypothetical predicted protein [Mytilus galloprovincialis]
MPPRGRGGGDIVLDNDVSFPLERLFDHRNLDHLPRGNRLDQFEKRDLAHVKHYKAAVKIFGGPLSRKRVIQAPPMETPMKHRLGVYLNKKDPPPPIKLCSEMKSKPFMIDENADAIAAGKKAVAEEDSYKKWIADRQKFRHDLDNMGLNAEWLRRKTNKTELEKRVYRKMVEEAKPKPIIPEPIVEKVLEAMISIVPSVKIPSPLGVRILEQHLRKNQIRLIDLFVMVDRDKNWRISREEFKQAIRESKVTMSESLLEDMILSLDSNFDNYLDYKELAEGLNMWRKERRENKRKALSRESTNLSQKSETISATPQSLEELYDEPDYLELMKEGKMTSALSRHQDTSEEDIYGDPELAKSKESPKSSKGSLRGSAKGRIDSGISKTSAKSSRKSVGIDREPSEENIVIGQGEGDLKDSAESEVKVRIGSAKRSASRVSGSSRASTPQYLEVPEQDLKPDRMILSSEEAMVDLRKRDREALKNSTRQGSPKVRLPAPGVIKVGDKAIDDHSMRSTLKGETADMVNKFRELKLREYCDITKLCKLNGIILSERLLEKVLLYPPDRPHHEIHRNVKTPADPLLSSHYAEPKKRPRTPIEVKHKDKVKRSKSGKLMFDSRHRYPQKSNVASSGTKENLSTGRAVIRSKVDCWMTFEEYERLTRHLETRYQQLHGSIDTNAFWPGHLLDKVRLCMPPYDKQHPSLNSSNALFRDVGINRRSHVVPIRENSAWPVNEYGFVQNGIYDPYARKY